MSYVVEFYYKGEVIERREYSSYFISPDVGDVVHIEFTNPAYNSDGNWWLINERRIIFFASDLKTLKQTLMLNVVPDKNNGAWKSDPTYAV